jgi:hypothetical protein
LEGGVQGGTTEIKEMAAKPVQLTSPLYRFRDHLIALAPRKIKIKRSATQYSQRILHSESFQNT